MQEPVEEEFDHTKVVRSKNFWDDFWIYSFNNINWLAMFCSNTNNKTRRFSYFILYVASCCILLSTSQYTTSSVMVDCPQCSSFTSTECSYQPNCAYDPIDVICSNKTNSITEYQICSTTKTYSRCTSFDICFVKYQSMNKMCQMKYLYKSDDSSDAEKQCRSNHVIKNLLLSIAIGAGSSFVNILFSKIVRIEYCKKNIITGMTLGEFITFILSLILIPISLVIPHVYQWKTPSYLKDPYLYRMIYSQFGISVVSGLFSDILLGLLIFGTKYEVINDLEKINSIDQKTKDLEKERIELEAELKRLEELELSQSKQNTSV